MISKDQGFAEANFTRNIRQSPLFWKQKRSEQIAMMSQIGPPTIFLTLTLCESKNPELLALLHKNAGLGTIDLETAMRLPHAIKTQLVRNDPVTVVQYFEDKLKAILKLFEDEDGNGPFGMYYMMDYYARKEFQNRRSVHCHLLIYLKDAPKLTVNSKFEDLIQFVDSIITCRYDPTNPLITHQRHKHTHTCYKGRNSKSCRFSFPKYVMRETEILLPLTQNLLSSEDMKKIAENLDKIDLKMLELFKKNSNIPHSDLLTELKLTHEEYIDAIRSTVKRPKLFLRRSSLEVAINPYNLYILQLTESNMDIQFILDPHACIRYICDYLTKSNKELSKLLRDAQSHIQAGDLSIRDRMLGVAKTMINGTVLTAQEAVYNILSLPLSQCSRGYTFINTQSRSARNRMLKTKEEMKKLKEDSTDIYKKNIFIHYAKRDPKYENVWLIMCQSTQTELSMIANLIKKIKLMQVMLKTTSNLKILIMSIMA